VIHISGRWTRTTAGAALNAHFQARYTGSFRADFLQETEIWIRILGVDWLSFQKPPPP
jgi:hypothetical protein